MVTHGLCGAKALEDFDGFSGERCGEAVVLSGPVPSRLEGSDARPEVRLWWNKLAAPNFSRRQQAPFPGQFWTQDAKWRIGRESSDALLGKSLRSQRKHESFRFTLRDVSTRGTDRAVNGLIVTEERYAHTSISRC